MTSSASNPTSPHLNHRTELGNVVRITLCQVRTLFLLCTVRKMFGSFSSCPDAGKKTSFWGQVVTPRMLSNARDSTMNSARSILESSQKTSDYTYHTPWPTPKKSRYAPTSYSLQTSTYIHHQRTMLANWKMRTIIARTFRKTQVPMNIIYLLHCVLLSIY